MTRFMGSLDALDTARFVLRGYPYDGTCSYKPGSRFGPAEIRAHSEGIETYSPRFDMDIDDIPFFDAGDLEFPFGDRDGVLERIELDAESLLSRGFILFGIGGEHLVSLPLIRSAHRNHPNLQVFHFDAHMDLREHYLDDRLSHATVMRRVLDFLPVEQFHQFDIRSGTRDEWLFSRKHGILKGHPCDVLTQLDTDTPVYVSIDLDVLDPAVFPGTGTPEPGGLTFVQLVEQLSAFRGKRIVGADFVELAPNVDPTDVSTIVAAKLIREMMVIAHG